MTPEAETTREAINGAPIYEVPESNLPKLQERPYTYYVEALGKHVSCCLDCQNAWVSAQSEAVVAV